MKTLTRKFTAAFAVLAAVALMIGAGPATAQQDKELPSNAIGLVKGDVIKFQNSAAGLSAEERVTQFWKSLRNAYGTHFRKYDREVRKDDIILNYNSELGVHRIKFRNEVLVEVNSTDARNHGRPQSRIARNWLRLLRRHIVHSQPENSKDVVF